MTLINELRVLLEAAEDEGNYFAKQKIMVKIRDKIDEIEIKFKELEREEVYSVWD